MGKIIFVIGGARSGKSRFAIDLVRARRKAKTAFIATCRPLDGEMRARIAAHKRVRPSHWRTFEEPERLSAVLEKMGEAFEWIVIDCLTLLVSNLLLKRRGAQAIKDEIGAVISRLGKGKAASVIVSNEVGMGIVPGNRLGRDFRDVAGRINQLVAARADEIYFMVSGIPWRIK